MILHVLARGIESLETGVGDPPNVFQCRATRNRAHSGLLLKGIATAYKGELGESADRNSPDYWPSEFLPECCLYVLMEVTQKQKLETIRGARCLIGGNACVVFVFKLRQ